MILRTSCGFGRWAAATICLISQLDSRVSAAYKIDTVDGIKETARSMAADLRSHYHGDEYGQVPGILPGPPSENKGPYYWWQGGALMGTFIDYWHLTGDTTYNDLVMQGMLHQVGGSADYMTENYSLSLGNDDQAFWGMSALLAAETRFPNPPADKPQWLALAQSVWATQADPSRHDELCGGGLHWQIPPTNKGYDYKNTISNGCFFNMGARLARYTNNDTYAKYAEASWDWIWEVKYIDHESWLVYDGGYGATNCSILTRATYSYNAAILLQGAAFMYNYTNGDEKWKSRIDKLLAASLKNFFPKGVAYEPNCEMKQGQCTADMLSFKGYVHRWLSVVTQVAPFTRETILPVLKNSTEAAVAQCTGGSSGRVCGFYWSSGKYYDPEVDHTSGAGEAMSALAAVSSLLIDGSSPPVTNATGGISKGNDGSGHANNGEKKLPDISTGDRAGAWILTVLCFGLFVAGFVWVSMAD
ncbi:Mannan endo-1,6-alpha-mannosidase DCW1 [Metarhizium brunneum]|uniref:Mannan endo-1,6-alpha-mannosidase n=1 Tax=Metarhizium brunneum TaxID=500148 RepID=A0A7D5UXK7_9HYPO